MTDVFLDTKYSSYKMSYFNLYFPAIMNSSNYVGNMRFFEGHIDYEAIACIFV